MHYYNEHNAYRAAVLRERIKQGLLPQGVVDERDIQAVPDEDFIGYEQVHLFAGIGGFPLGMRLAGFPEHVRVVDGGFPCQDISNAGKRAGITGSRSRLWREMVRCIRVVRPHYVFVENVAALLCRGMGEVLGDLAEIGYDARGDCVSAADVGAPHLRRRIWIVAHTAGNLRGTLGDEGPESPDGRGEVVADASSGRLEICTEIQARQSSVESGGEVVADATETRCSPRKRGASGTPRNEARRPQPERFCSGVPDAEEFPERPGLRAAESRRERSGRFGNGSGWPVEPDVGRVANGVPSRVDRLAALGDAIVPQCAAEAIRRLFDLQS